MKQLYLIALLACLFVGCGTQRQAFKPQEPVIIHSSDSIRSEYIETLRIDTVTIYVSNPSESVTKIGRCSTSHLETSVAESDAWIEDDGTLGHSLKNKPEERPVEVSVPVKEIQNNNSAEKIREVPVPYPEPVYIERELTLWQSFRLRAFWYLAGVSIISIGWILRKPLMAIVRKLIA